MRKRAFTLAMVAVLVGSAFAGPVGAAAAPASNHEASVSFAGGTAGATVVVDEVYLPEGGFVTIHDGSLAEGNVLGSVVGTSDYLEPGTHENVTVALTDEVSDGTFHAMAHRDTTNDRIYRFVSSNGETDGPYTVDGDVVMDSAEVTVSATVEAVDQSTAGEYVVVDRVALSEGGFVTVHDSTLADGAVFGSIRGTSEYLEPGVHENVRIQLDEPLTGNETVFAMAHRDTNDDETYDFPDTEGEEDGPYVDADGDIVMAAVGADLDDEAYTEFSNATSGGHAVVVDEVYLPEGGFVTVHDSTLADGAVFESIRGTSEYLEPGLHRDVVVRLDEPLTGSETVFAMAHRDTNDNEAYDFPDTEGEEDGPYTTDDGLVMDDGTVAVSASVAFEPQSSDGTTVVVDRVDLSEGGFVTVHDASLLAGEVTGSVIGTSEYLEPGVHEDVEVTLDEPLRSSQTAYAMPHRDTNGNDEYDFVSSDGEADGPFTQDGNILLDPARVSVTATVGFSEQSVENRTVTVDSVTLHDGGFVTIHGPSLADGDALGSVLGTSDYLGPGTHENVSIELDRVPDQDGTFFAMPHRDTNGNEVYDFVTSEGTEDAPYFNADDQIVLDGAQVTVEGSAEASVTFNDQTLEDDVLNLIGGTFPGTPPHATTRNRLDEQLVVLNDDNFKWFAQYGLSVNARNVLDNDTKESQNLWYEETLPPDSLLYATLAERTTNSGNGKSPLSLAAQLFDDDQQPIPAES